MRRLLLVIALFATGTLSWGCKDRPSQGATVSSSPSMSTEPAPPPAKATDAAQPLSPELRQRWAELLGRGVVPPRSDGERRFLRECFPVAQSTMVVANEGRGTPPDAILRVAKERAPSLKAELRQWCADYAARLFPLYLAAVMGVAGRQVSAPAPDDPVGLPGWAVGKTVTVTFRPEMVLDESCVFDGAVAGHRCRDGSSGGGAAPKPDGSTLEPHQIDHPEGLHRYFLAFGLWRHPKLRALAAGGQLNVEATCQLTLKGTAKGAKVSSPLGSPVDGLHPFVGALSGCSFTTD